MFSRIMWLDLDAYVSCLAETRRRRTSPTVTEWKYPMSSADALKYTVFSHFWEAGYFLTCGGKFGGDFLIYPGVCVCARACNILLLLTASFPLTVHSSGKKTIVVNFFSLQPSSNPILTLATTKLHAVIKRSTKFVLRIQSNSYETVCCCTYLVSSITIPFIRKRNISVFRFKNT